MNRFFFVLLLILCSIVFFSCKKDIARCWEVTVYMNDVQSTVSYVWGTEDEVKEATQFDQVVSGLKYRVEIKNVYGSNEAYCTHLTYANKDSTEVETCWKMTTTVGGSTSTYYMWAKESIIKMQVNAVKLIGTASYERANANDVEACDKLN